MRIVDIVLAAHKREEKQKMIITSFGSWQVIETVKSLLSEKAKQIKFGDYLKRLGLLEKANPQQTKITQAQQRQALTTAEQIKLLDKRRKGGD